MGAIDSIRQSVYDYPNWEGCPAKAMLVTFHLEKLIEIRQFAVSQKQLILQVYTYIRDSHAKSFYQESMSSTLWERVGNLNGPSIGFNDGGAQQDETPCRLCNNKDFHRLLNIPGQKHHCPLKPLAKLQEGIKWVVDKRRAMPTANAHKLLASALLQFV